MATLVEWFPADGSDPVRFTTGPTAPLRLLPGVFTAAQALRTWTLLSGTLAHEDAMLERMTAWGWVEPIAGTCLWRARPGEIARVPAWWTV